MEPLLAFRSISTDKAYQGEIKKLVVWLAKQFTQRDFEVEIIKGFGNPIIVASYEVDPQLPTVLIYGHYDVQPADIDEGWDSEPFSFSVRDGRLFGRGVVDNKGQVGVHIATVMQLIKQQRLRYNVKFMLEGDEETGSPLMEKFVRQNLELLASDLVLISDGEVVAGAPVIECGFRGCFNATLTATTARTDVHSGMFGGGIPNAAAELMAVLNKMHHQNPSQIAIPGWEDDVEPANQQTLANHQALPFSTQDLEELTGVKTHFTRDQETDFYSQVTLFPSVEVTGFSTGYTGIGYRNSIPAQAVAKVNFRTAPSQDPKRLITILSSWLEEQFSDYVDWELELDEPSAGVVIDIDNEHVQRARQVQSKVYGQDPYVKHVGGTLPIITLFNEFLQVPQVVVPLANEDCGMHAPNENFELQHLNQALQFSENFLGQ